MAGTLHRALLNRYALGTALSLLIAPFAGIEKAEACTPSSPVNNATINCTGTTTDANGNIGFGSGTDTGNTINVGTSSTPATVNGTAIGIQSLNPIINNFGTIIGGDEAVSAVTLTLNNSGILSSTTGDAVSVSSGLVLTNSGSITTVGNGSNGVTVAGSNNSGISVTNTATGTITASGAQNGGTPSVGIDIGANTGTINNAGTISAQGTGGIGVEGAGLMLTNSGHILAAATGVLDNGSINVTNTSGATINASDVNGIGISAVGGGTINNAGHITATDATGIGVNAGTNITVTNTGGGSLISGGTFGISAGGTATVTNNSGGTISATGANGVAIGSSDPTPVNTVTLANAGLVQANGTGGIAVVGQTVNVTSNTGMVSGIRFGIDATKTANITNNAGGTIQATGAAGIAIGSSDPSPANTVTLANAGTIKGGDGAAIQAQTVNITSNSGTISADGAAIVATGAITIVSSGQITSKRIAIQNSTNAAVNVTNSGLISGVGGMEFAGGGSVTNSGTISGTSFAAISFTGPSSITNFAGGTISAKIAIQDNGPTIITNSGTIRSTDGATGTAIQLSNASDTLNIKNGSSIIGLIDMGHGADVINVDSTIPSSKGVSMLSRATGAVIDALTQQLRNFDGVINTIGSGNAGGQPTVTVNGKTASLDPTALAQQDRTLMDFTGGMSSMVQGRLGGAATGSGPQAMSYAMEDARAEMFSKAPAASWNAPVNVWSSAFGATRSQNGTDTTLDSTSSVYGGVIGVDRRIRPDWLVGAFAGGGSGTLNVDLGSQKLSTDYFSAGAYSRFEWDAQFIDMTLQAGGINNRSTRLVQNNITGGGETATASYNGWFVSPEVAYGYHIDLGNGTMVTPTARVRYVAGLFGGYTETGSAQTLTIGSRTLQDFEERGEVEVSKTGFLGDAALKGTLHGGVIALQRVGDSTVNAVLIGQNLSFITPGKSSAVGAVGGVGLDYHVTPNVALFGAVEGMMMSDQSRIGSAKGGVRVAF
jgi:outer membrane autotransporter protein